MKSSPAKGKLGDFFKGIGSQLKQGQKERGIFSEKGRAEKKYRKPGESQYQASNRKRIEDYRASKKVEKSTQAREKLKPGEFTTKQKLERKLVPNQELMNKKVEVKNETEKVISPKKEVVTPEKTTKKDSRPPGSSDSYQKKHKTGKYAVKTSQNKFRVQTSVNVDASGNTFPQSQGFKTKEEANSYMDANKGSFMYEVDKDGKRIKNTSSSNPSSKTSTSTAENKKKTSTKSRLTKIMQPGFMHIIDAMTKKKK